MNIQYIGNNCLLLLMFTTYLPDDECYNKIMKNMDENFNMNFYNDDFNKVKFEDIIRIVKKYNMIISGSFLINSITGDYKNIIRGDIDLFVLDSANHKELENEINYEYHHIPRGILSNPKNENEINTLDYKEYTYIGITSLTDYDISFSCHSQYTKIQIIYVDS